MPPFKLGINMAGAVSAGAYTAGVLDFLTEVLDDWYAQKKVDPTVPAHDISIEVFTGASAGGMCAAISAILLQDNFEHISDTSKTGTTNRFYESWVNKIDIQPLLGSADLADPNSSVDSLLDSSIIEEIAQYALTRKDPLPEPRPYVSPNLNIFLSLTNLRGVPYSIVSVAPGSVEESTFFYGDRIRFQLKSAASFDTYPPPPIPDRILDVSPAAITYPPTTAWLTLQTAAMATGGFPVFLKPRVLPRFQAEYCPPGWESVASADSSTPPTTPPHFPPAMPDPFKTVNVDGGVTNNDPFNYAHDFLLACSSQAPSDRHLISTAGETDRAVLSIAPFPTTQAYDPVYDPEKQSAVIRALPALFGALISQSRFFGQSLSKLLSGASFSNFIIAPSDDDLRKQYLSDPSKTPPALQCAALSAFGGFFERGFRAHDFALGRRNCQKFLVDHFLLPQDNVIIAASLPKDPAALAALLKQYGRPDPTADKVDPAAPLWLPIIPICSQRLREPIPEVPRFQITDAKLDIIVDLIFSRFRTVVSKLIAPAPWALRTFLAPGPRAISLLAKGPLKKALVTQLGDSYKA
jgi:predicted acylesterase/phospholipase RssA